MKLDKLEKGRVVTGPFSSPRGVDFGFFFISLKPGSQPLKVMAAPMHHPDSGWQHVSVSHPNRCPTWEEMCAIKDLFWDEEETVVQFHPPKSEWISNSRYCLHLWRWTDGEFPRPPGWTVGVKELGTLD